ncbi:MAG TPA: hypothetical protein VMW04_03760 [Patescibacteria group bacterium]|nr:hypothetical protein [Patescibacteria group bacterium]
MARPQKEFKHDSLKFREKNKIVFTSFSKRNFFLRFQVSAFVLTNNGVPISPFMNFDYNLSGLVDKTLIRIANNTMIKKADELWVFGEVSDGVLVEIFMAKRLRKPVRYFLLSEEASQIKEISEPEVRLEEISPWMWEWVMLGKNLGRWHPRLQSRKTYPLVYAVYSKRNFFWHMQISKFCLEKRVIPLNPFMLFKYFLGDLVPRDMVRKANNNIIRIVDQLWVFGEISDGVLAEIKMAKERGSRVLIFKIVDGNPVKFRKISPKGAVFEGDWGKYRQIIS